MTNQEILEKAIQKAYDNGWLWWNEKGERFKFDIYAAALAVDTFTTTRMRVLFDKDFAKALWGEEPRSFMMYYKVTANPATTNETKPTVTTKPAEIEWQYHLQQMVIAEDPIKYLGENI